MTTIYETIVAATELAAKKKKTKAKTGKKKKALGKRKKGYTFKLKTRADVETAVVFPAGKYSWFAWGKTSAKTITSAKGREYELLKGAEFGVRPATSKAGMYRVITQQLGPGVIFSMDQEQVDDLIKGAKPATGEGPGPAIEKVSPAVKKQAEKAIVLRLEKYCSPIHKKFDMKDQWGDDKYFFDDVSTAKWLKLMNKILKGIPAALWPGEYRTGNGGVSIELQLGEEWDEKEGIRLANLSFDNEDHTAWVIETKVGSGVYKNYDIGGS